jgi:hypothetical protein
MSGLSIPMLVYMYGIFADIPGGCISEMLADAMIFRGTLGA